MVIMNVNEIRRYRLDVPTIAPTPAREAAAPSATSSIRAGQRRLRTEAVGLHALKAVPDELVLALVKYGNNPDGLPALLYATKMGDLAAVKLLINYGADPFTREQGQGALYFALKSKNHQLVEYFLKLGLDPNDEGVWGELNFGGVWVESLASIDTRSFELLIAHGLKLNSTFYVNQWAPALVCIQYGRLDLLKLVLVKGGDIPTEYPNNSMSPALWAISYAYPGRGKEKLECLKWLIQTGILKPKDLENPGIGMLIGSSYPEFLAYLIDNKHLKVNQKIGGLNRYPLHECSYKPDLVRLLIQKGADVNIREEDYGRTPLHNLAHMNLDTWSGSQRHDVLASIKILLENGADLTAKDKFGQTPFSLATDPTIKKLLIEYVAK